MYPKMKQRVSDSKFHDFLADCLKLSAETRKLRRLSVFRLKNSNRMFPEWPTQRIEPHMLKV